jgi:hypothetical protein
MDANIDYLLTSCESPLGMIMRVCVCVCVRAQNFNSHLTPTPTNPPLPLPLSSTSSLLIAPHTFSVTVDHILYPFRVRAGKPNPSPGPRAQVGFWDTDLKGANAGRFLMGAGNTLRWVGTPFFL